MALLALAALLVALAPLSASCQKPDASNTTSPSILALVGVSEGNITYADAGSPPPDTPAPAGWQFDLGNVRFSKLENEQRSLQIVTTVQAKPGPALELWMTGPGGNIFRWSGGSTRNYDGVVCFQVRLENETESLPLGPGAYAFTMAFRDPADGEVVVAKTVTIAGFAPASRKPAPATGSSVARDLLGCPRAPV